MAKPYEIEKLPLKDKINYNEFTRQLVNANASVAKFEGILESIINKDLLLNPLSKKEAVLSSKIEGTQATLTDILEMEADLKLVKRIEADVGVIKIYDKYKYDDFIEINNYNKAIEYAVQELDDKQKISLWLIRNIHKILLDGARGKNKSPGEFRIDQNWIGKAGCGMEEASFIPVSPEKLVESLENLEEYMCSYEEQTYLVQVAIIHAQFEMIHPFKDGNGRIGRMLIPLFLYYKKLMSRPVLYISEYLEENRDEYYFRLNNISQYGDWSNWIIFFLKALENQADTNILRTKKLKELYEKYKIIINETLNSKNSIFIVDSLFKVPIFKASKLSELINEYTKVDPATIDRYISKMVDVGILAPEDKQRDKKYYFKELIDLLQ